MFYLRLEYLLVASLSLSLYVVKFSNADDDLNTSDEFHKDVAQLIELRGFIGINHYVTSEDGYIMNLVEMRNPTINNGQSIGPKDPVLFIHGTLANGKFFLVNSVGAKPRNYAHLNASSLSLEELNNLLAQDPTSNSIAFSVSNFGHSVWILNRRGTAASQGHIGKDTQPYKNPIMNGAEALFGGLLPPQFTRVKRQVNLATEQPLQALPKILSQPNLDLDHTETLVNPRYWHFKLDEQAKYDIPKVIDYILEQTRREKLSLITHSAGGALLLMSLINNPELAYKISKSINYAPALYPSSIRATLFSALLGPALRTYIGPITPSQTVPFFHKAMAAACSFKLVMHTLCNRVVGFFTGYAGNQQLLYPGFVTAFFDSFGSRALSQIIQAANKGKMHFYDFANPAYNFAVYNQTTPPIYNVSRIISQTITFWVGNTDGLVLLRDAQKIINDMVVPVKLYHIDKPGLAFDHNSFALHRDIATLLVIPSLKELESI